MLGLFATLFAYVALVGFLIWAPKVRKRWLRISFRILGVVGIVPLIIVLPALLFSLALTAGDPPAQTRVIQSPDGKQAKLIYQAGFLGRDNTRVTLKQADSCRHTTVFWHAGPSWFNDPKLEWLDNRHLSIAYHMRPGDPHHCEEQLGPITIICTSKPWPSSAPAVPPSMRLSTKP